MNATVTVKQQCIGTDGLYHAEATAHANRRAVGWGATPADAETHARERIAGQMASVSVQTLCFGEPRLADGRTDGAPGMVLHVIRDAHLPTNTEIHVVYGSRKGASYRPSDDYPRGDIEQSIRECIAAIACDPGSQRDATGGRWWNGREYVAG